MATYHPIKPNAIFFIDVILPIPVKQNFTYSITQAEAKFLNKGMRVAVPFGKHKIHTSIVVNIHQNPPKVYDAKPIFQIIDDSPIITETQLQLWQWIANYYMCTVGEVMRAALPNAFLIESETLIVLNTSINIDSTTLNDNAYLIYDALKQESSLKVSQVMDILDKKRVLPLINKMVDDGIIVLKEELYEKYKPKLVRYVRLNTNYNSSDALEQLLKKLSNAPKQRQVILSLFTIKAQHKHKPIKVSELSKVSGVSKGIIKALITKGILEEHYIQNDRIENNNAATNQLKTLNTAQNEALKNTLTGFKNNKVVLLHGVTSSGKTEIYVKLIESALNKNKQVLYLLPEIALTTQLVQRLQAYFGDKVAVFHSRYSGNERVEVWNNMLKNHNKVQLIIGARSAVLLPFKNLGLIIVDEEHEQSFKQFDPAPRYHARDTAIVLANLTKANIILGTATPSLESYQNAAVNKYHLVELKYRYNNVVMPDIQLIDIADKYKRKRMKGHFSDTLIEEIRETLSEGYQVILFQNRRGYSPIVECNTCGHSPQCPNCDVSLTYHQYRNQLRCHYCSYNIIMPKSCEACGNASLDTKGFGTQQIEAEIDILFPDYNVARMDLDTTRGKYGFEKIITKFEQREIDILVGTQMLTKGLDFRHVKLVGILNADNLLNFPDFRAHERSYQLIAQVAGRAGRTDIRGKVFIQTYNPHHNILQQVSENNYKAMFVEQLNERKNFKYPPYYKSIKITLKHKDYNKVNDAADWLAKYLRHYFKANVLGPEFPAIARIRNQFIKHILLKIPPQQALKSTKDIILKIDTSFNAVSQFRPVRIIYNVDN